MRQSRLVIVAVLCLFCFQSTAQRLSRKAMAAQIAALTAKVDSLQSAVSGCLKVSMATDPNWEKWQDVRYNYGFNTSEQPVFATVDGVLESRTMLSVRGGRGRWNSNTAVPPSGWVDGSHVFEGWNASETCRLTMLIGKQAPDIACIQVYSPKELYREKRHFGWVKLGSDDAREGVDFGRRWALSFVPFTLGRFDKAPTTTLYHNEQIESTAVPVGTIYYNTANDKIGCYTKEGWKYLKFE